jgi:hypothetical protein
MATDWVEVYTATSELDAELVKGLLATERIPVIVEAHGFKAMPYIFGTSGVGQLVLKVPPDLAHLAREILQAQVQPEGDAE